MKILALVIAIILASCVFYTYRPFMNFNEKNVIAMGKGNKLTAKSKTLGQYILATDTEKPVYL